MLCLNILKHNLLIVWSHTDYWALLNRTRLLLPWDGCSAGWAVVVTETFPETFICFVFDYNHHLASSEINAMYWSSFLLKFSSPPPSALFIVVALKNLLLVHIIWWPVIWDYCHLSIGFLLRFPLIDPLSKLPNRIRSGVQTFVIYLIMTMDSQQTHPAASLSDSQSL